MMSEPIVVVARMMVICVVLGLGGLCDAEPVPERFLPETEIPDLMQLDPKGDFEGGGVM